MTHNMSTTCGTPMNPAEFDAISAALALFDRPIHALQWGGGESTILLSSRLSPGSRWSCYDHDAACCHAITTRLTAAGAPATIIHVAPNRPFDGLSDGNYLTFRNYIVAPAQSGSTFDFVVVDGRARVECMAVGWGLLEQDGILVLRDAQRRQYDDGIPAESYWLRVTQRGDAGQTLFAAKRQETIRALAAALETLASQGITLQENTQQKANPPCPPFFKGGDAKGTVLPGSESDRGAATTEQSAATTEGGAATTDGAAAATDGGAAADGGRRPAILFLNVYYNGFLTHIYREKHPDLAAQPFQVQKQLLIDDLFGDSDYYTHNLAFHGWRADDLIVNAAPAQAAWARENGVAGEDFALILEQIRRFAPDVLYIQDMYAYPEAFLDFARKLGVKLIAGQIASPMADGTPFHAYDLIFSSFPHFVERFNRAGIKSVLQPLAFEPRVLSRIPRYEYRERPVHCSFVGGISHMHKKGNELLEVLVGRTPLELWGYGAESLPADSPIRARHNGEAWGRSMYCVMASSRITINRHIDVAENNANNLRLYEATGCGALLITDDKQNLRDMFEPGKEVVVYRSPEECASLVNYYIEHPDEAQAIAEAGQARTLRDHCYRVRMERTGAILREHIHDQPR